MSASGPHATTCGAATPDACAARFGRMCEVFDAVRKRHADHVRVADYRFGGRPVRIQVAGAALSDRVARAFAHLAAAPPESAAPALRIDVWDEEATGVACPLTGPEQCAAAHVWSVDHGVFTASEDGSCIGFCCDGAFTMFDRRRHRIVGCRPSAGRLSRAELSKPFRILLSVWYHDNDIHMFHAGLVARDGLGVLIPGRERTGKSTVALSCVNAGMDYAGDDFVGLRRRADGTFVGHSMYGSACVALEHLARFPGLEPHALEDKAVLYVSDLYADRMKASVRIAALALPCIVDTERSRVRPARRPDVLLRLAPSTLMYVIPRPERQLMRLMRELVERTPCFVLELGSDLASIPVCMADILDRAASS